MSSTSSILGSQSKKIRESAEAKVATGDISGATPEEVSAYNFAHRIPIDAAAHSVNVKTAARLEEERIRKHRANRSGTIITGSAGVTSTPTTLKTTLG